MLIHLYSWNNITYNIHVCTNHIIPFKDQTHPDYCVPLNITFYCISIHIISTGWTPIINILIHPTKVFEQHIYTELWTYIATIHLNTQPELPAHITIPNITSNNISTNPNSSTQVSSISIHFWITTWYKYIQDSKPTCQTYNQA